MQPFSISSEPPVTCCLGLSSGHMLLVNNAADACTVALPACRLTSFESSHSPTVPPVVHASALPCSAPIVDMAIADLQGLGQNQVDCKANLP